MLVVQLVGREAGSIQEQPYAAATSNIAAGTARAPTEAELAAANLLQPSGGNDAAPEALPDGFECKPNVHGGYDLFGPDGAQLNDQPFPNLAAARSMAHAHAGAAAGPDLDNMRVADLKEFAAEKKIDLGDAKNKTEILEAIKAALAKPPATSPGLRIVPVDGSEDFFDVVNAEGVKVNDQLLTKEEAHALVANPPNAQA